MKNNNITLFRRDHLSGDGNQFETDLFTIIRTHKYKDIVETLRAKRHSLSDEEFEHFKMGRLPVYTGCCTCEGSHQTGTIKNLSGYVVGELKNVSNISGTKRFLATQCFVAAVWLSCCGNNLLFAMPFSRPIDEFHNWLWDVEGYFLIMGYRICKTARNFRNTTLVSYDPEPYINPDAWDWFTPPTGDDGFVKPLKRRL